MPKTYSPKRNLKFLESALQRISEMHTGGSLDLERHKKQGMQKLRRKIKRVKSDLGARQERAKAAAKSSRKYTPEKIRFIRGLIKDGLSDGMIADIMGASKKTINNIRHGVTYGDVK